MISYRPLWETLNKKDMSTYYLIYKQGLSANTIYRMKQGKAVTTNTIKTWGRCFCLGELLQIERTERQKQRPHVFLACCRTFFCILSLGRYQVVAVSPFGVTSKLCMPVITREYT